MPIKQLMTQATIRGDGHIMTFMHVGFSIHLNLIVRISIGKLDQTCKISILKDFRADHNSVTTFKAIVSECVTIYEVLENTSTGNVFSST